MSSPLLDVVSSASVSHVFMMSLPAFRFWTRPRPPLDLVARFFAAVIRPPLLFFAIFSPPLLQCFFDFDGHSALVFAFSLSGLVLRHSSTLPKLDDPHQDHDYNSDHDRTQKAKQEPADQECDDRTQSDPGPLHGYRHASHLTEDPAAWAGTSPRPPRRSTPRPRSRGL